jgi:uncharacterized protein with HEPN domain
MSKRGDREFLYDIKEAIERIENYVGKMNYEEFFQNTLIQDAVIRNLEIIGEATKNLSKNLTQNHSDVEWKDFAGIRDKIIHFYFGVNWSIVWSAIKDKLPKLKEC